MILIVTFIILLGAWIYFKSKQAHSIWKRKGATEIEPSFLFGQTKKLVFNKQSSADMVLDMYNKFPNKRYVGFYQFYRPMLLIKDPDLLKQLTVKDFDHFTDHTSLVAAETDYLFNNSLFSLKGDKWRHMRATLSPAFTSSRIKAMFPLMAECSKQFTEYFMAESAPNTIELKEVASRFANDVLATCAFGVQCDSLKQKDNEFYRMGKLATDFNNISSAIKFTAFLLVPKICKFIGLKFFAAKVEKFFRALISDTIKLREEKQIIRPDMIHLLMQAKKGQLEYEENQAISKETGFATVEESDVGKVSNKHKLKITEDDICAQALQFFFAGFDTVSSIVSFMGYELAVNPDVQDRLRDEIDQMLIKYKGTASYDAVNEMKYLDMVLSETLRKWPALAGVDRECVIPYTIKSETPDESDLKLDVGQAIFIPTWGFHYDPQYYPNPEKFDPDRFSNENKHNIKPYTYLPFGVGPRNCIGSRFALLEIKILFINLLSKLELHVVEKTPIPMQLLNGMTNLTAKDGFWVGLKPRKH